MAPPLRTSLPQSNLCKLCGPVRWIDWPSLLDRNKREQTGFVTPK